MEKSEGQINTLSGGIFVNWCNIEMIRLCGMWNLYLGLASVHPLAIAAKLVATWAWVQDLLLLHVLHQIDHGT